jgi:hypothetical protein
MEKVGIFYVTLEFITVIWYILWPIGNLHAISPILVLCVKKNLATLVPVLFQLRHHFFSWWQSKGDNRRLQ